MVFVHSVGGWTWTERAGCLSVPSLWRFEMVKAVGLDKFKSCRLFSCFELWERLRNGLRSSLEAVVLWTAQSKDETNLAEENVTGLRQLRTRL